MNNKRIKWGILGCGHIAHKFAAALTALDDAELYAAAARDYGRANDFATQYGFNKAYGSYRELVADPEIDIIYVATPHSYHFLHTKLCLEAGKHVLCEKPFTVNANQLRELIALAKSKNRFLMEAIWTRFLPQVEKVKAIIESGEIGEVIAMDADFGIRFDYRPEFRLFNPQLAAGALLDLGIYPLFLALYLFGKPEKLQSVSRLHENQFDLYTSMILTHQGDVISNLSSSSVTDTPIEATIYGTSGSIRIHRLWFTPSSITLNINGKQPQTIDFPPLKNGYEYEAMESMECLFKGKTGSSRLPLEFSMGLMETMDVVRKNNGIIYPAEIESLSPAYGEDEL